MLATVLVIMRPDKATTPTGLGVLAVPEAGKTVAGFLNDGRPVFVVHDLDGTIVVIEAVSTHRADGAMAWCPTSRTIDDVPHGARWDPQGRYVSGPGPRDLGRYDTRILGNNLEVVATGYVDPPPRSASPVGAAGPLCVEGGYEIHPFHNGP